MHLHRHVVLASLSTVAFGEQKRDTPSSFQLFAYGDGLGGLPMVNSGGFAYLGDPILVNSSDAAPVVFSPGSDNTWIGAPNTTDLANGTAPSWSNVTLFIPGSSGGRVGFLDSGNSTSGDVITTGFVFYGSTAMVIGEDGGLESLWSGLPVGNTSVHQLFWNDTSQGQVPVIMRRMAPSNPIERSK